VGREEMDSCLSRLRYVKKGDYVMSSDINDPRECLERARDWLLEICNRYGLDPEYVYELDPYLERIRRVSAGDIIEPDDHNNIVDALHKIRDVIYSVEANTYNKGYQAGYEDGYNAALQEINRVLVVTADQTYTTPAPITSEARTSFTVS